MTKAKTERNAKIYKDKMGGMSWTKMILKYKLAYTTMRHIVQREKLANPKPS